VNDDKIQNPEPASIWHESKTTSTTEFPRKTTKKMSLRVEKEEENGEFEVDSKLSLIDSEVDRDPQEWELKMRQLSRELSKILQKLKVRNGIVMLLTQFV
jgi:hypothetical protein